MAHESIAHLHSFLQMMVTEKKATRSTLSSYEADLQDFYRFLKNPSREQSIESVTSFDIQDYILTQNHLAPSTVARRLASVRQFWTFLITIGKVKEGLLSSLQVPPCQSKSSPAIKAEEMGHLLKAIKGEGRGEGKRLSLLLHLFLSNVPAHDLVALSLEAGLDALRNEHSFLVLHDDQGVSLTVSTLEALQEYMIVRYHFLVQGQESPWLFPSSSQKGHLTRQRFGQLVKEFFLKLGLDPADYSLYTIRKLCYDFKALN